MSPTGFVGRAVPRVDGWPKVAGTARYLTDMAKPRMAHAAVVRSPHPRAKVVSIDPTGVLARPGVLAVLTPDDVADLPAVRIFADSPPVQRILTATPQYTGDAVAAVVADTLESARAGAADLTVGYEPMPPVLTTDQALQADIILHPDAPGNLAGPVINIARGDTEAALSDCDHIFRASFRTQRQCAQTIEPLGCICHWNDDGLGIWTHLDSMFHFRDAVAESLALEPRSVRIHPPEALGATFGLKNSLLASLEPLAALCSRAVKRPVKLMLTPEESMSSTVTRHPARIDLVTGTDDNGKLLARTADVVLDSGAYGWGYVVALSMVGKWSSLYRTEHFRFTATSVYTNHVPGGAYRSVGTAQIHFAMESQLDDIARHLRIDPVELRRRNLIRVGDRLTFGTPVRSFGAEACLDRAAATFGWEFSTLQTEETSKSIPQKESPNEATATHPKPQQRHGAVRPQTETVPELAATHRRRGQGMAVGMHHAGLTGLTPIPEASRAMAELNPDGTVSVAVGAVDKGQGALTTLTLIAAEELGLPVERIRLRNSGTAGVPMDFSGAEASRTTYVIGRAVADAARRLRQTIRDRFEIEPADLRSVYPAYSPRAHAYDPAEGVAAIGSADQRAVDETRRPLRTQGRFDPAEGVAVIGSADQGAIDETHRPLRTEGRFKPADKDPLPVIGAHFCEVEVDCATGSVRVLRYVAAQDVGRVINPLGCVGQVEGGIHHGLGYALTEELLYDDGQPLNPNFMGYKVLMADDMPAIEAVLVEDPDPDGGPHGAKGIGTPIIPAIAPAVANAIYDAVGVRLTETPMTPPRVLAALSQRTAANSPDR